MRRILLVDDDARFRQECRQSLQAGDDVVVEASDGIEAIAICRSQSFDVILLDADFKELDSFSALMVLNKLYPTPVIMLSERDSADDRIRGLELGAVDYLEKPIPMRELALRIGSAIKMGRSISENSRFVYEGLEVNFLERFVAVDGRRVDLTSREYDLLFFMARNRGVVLNRDELMSGAWGFDCFVESRNVDSYIKQLRRKLEPYGRFIVTRRSMGYVFTTDLQVAFAPYQGRRSAPQVEKTGSR